ncbi:Aste57867_11882 [Aphanomyces stellatus]|uniref:E1 ubiquitin-activating enzyme n=1 Tax=Aphanomyces stellatus TaxID=120398 RepID=A0A485KVC5_9STRA|nr:hypothetical protein As57867_011837 [Aphanomyces stellatus]VFT88737.1 Aste57867_11882 [Aphanomyces stellatus]
MPDTNFASGSTITTERPTKKRKTTAMETLEGDAGFMDKYSRQIGAFGLETMAKLVKLKVLIVGMRGVGIECAKNLILAGPGAMTIHDDGLTEIQDVGVNFFLNEADVGTPRGPAVVHRLAELNKMVTVKAHTGALTEDLVRKHNVVVFTHTPRDDLIRWDTFCRAQSPAIGFINCDIRGAFGYAFTDFGPQFVTHDATGENPITRIITDITSDEDGLVSLLGPDDDGKMHELPDSDHDGWIEISEVEGMVSLDDPNESINTLGPYRIKFATKKVFRNGKQVEVFDPYHLKLVGGTARFSPYIGGGMFTQHKQPFTTPFRSFQEALSSPVHPGDYGLMFTDGAKFGRAEQLHVLVWGLMEFEAKHGHLPRLYNDDDADEVIAYAKEGPAVYADAEPFRLDEIDEKLLRRLIHVARIELHPLAAFYGGVIAQEVVKFTGKFTPLKQWMHLDFVEVLPDERPDDLAPQNSRYDHVIQVFGASVHEQLANVRTFLVGCGALGCEYLKNFAMVGVGCGPKGLITVTDNDRIEVSNLNRQFLFREHNVGQAKSVAATAAVRTMNQSLNVLTLEHLVAPTTEHVFNDPFWNDLDFVTNALDNIKARLYVDSKCVFYKKPLLESGTLGTKCNVQVVLPYKTASYADGPKDAPDDNIPMCTLRNFPSLIEHCIEWARAQFEDMFVVPFSDVSNFAQDPSAYLQAIRLATVDHPNPKLGASAVPSELERVRALHRLVTKGQLEFEDCIDMAQTLFCSLFRDRILQLIHNFPEDHLTKSGERFWSGAKRFPQAATAIDFTNTYHADFIRSVANLYAVNFGLQPLPEEEVVPSGSYLRQVETFAAYEQGHHLPEWAPSAEKIAENDEALKKQQEERSSNEGEVAELEDLLNDLGSLSPAQLAAAKRYVPADFEKDNDLNFHIDFIASAANLRAWNYRIKQVSRHKCKMIAGKIIPAIATTTASVTGLAMIELIKIVQGKKLDQFKDSSNSLGLNMYLLQEPAEPEKSKDEYDMIEMSEVKCKPAGFTKWDTTSLTVAPGITLSEFLDQLQEHVGLNVNLLFHAAAELGDADPKFGPVRGLMLYDRTAFSASLKALYKQKLDTPLREWVEERYQGLVDCDRPFVEFQTSCSDDDDVVYKIPTVVCRFQK